MQYIIISPEQPHIHRTLLSTSARLMDLLKLLKVEQAARVCQLENLHQRATPASTATDQGVAVQCAVCMMMALQRDLTFTSAGRACNSESKDLKAS